MWYDVVQDVTLQNVAKMWTPRFSRRLFAPKAWVESATPDVPLGSERSCCHNFLLHGCFLRRPRARMEMEPEKVEFEGDDKVLKITVDFCPVIFWVVHPVLNNDSPKKWTESP